MNLVEKPLQQQKSAYHPPRKFLFEFAEALSRKNSEIKTTPKVNHDQFQKSIPEVPRFPKPQNFEEAYQGMCDSLIIAFHQIRELLIVEKVHGLDSTIKHANFQDPKGCLEFFKNIIINFSQRLKDPVNSHDDSIKANEYEKMLQKSEIKIRDLIRNEQIYRLGFDQFASRQQEDEKVVASLEATIKQNWTLIEELNQENLKLSSLLQQKNEEIQSIAKEKENYFSAQVNSNGETLSSRIKNYSSNIIQNVSSPNSNRVASSHNDLKNSKNPNSPERSASRAKARTLHKSGTIAELIPSSIKNLNLHGLEKIRDEARNNIGVYTERRQGDNSGEQSKVNSARFAELFNLTKDLSDKNILMKPLSTNKTKKSQSVGKQRIKRDDTRMQEKFSPSGRANNYEEFVHSLLKVESSEDNTPKPSFRLAKFEKTRNIGDSLHLKEVLKANESQELKTKPSKRKSIITNPRSQAIPSREEKSAESKSQLLLRKEPSSASLISKDVSKVSLNENREKINKFLKNIMFQKLANSKKA